MGHKEIISLILAGGKGTRLGALTNSTPKPAVFYGGDYRIIDFTISNCINSGLKTIGILTQYLTGTLHKYIDNLNYTNRFSDIPIAKRPSDNEKSPYLGTADAIFKNLDYIDAFNPEYVLILSGDHIYKMDYAPMIQFHKNTKAAVTIASTPVPWSETHRYGILSSDTRGKVTLFEEKPKHSTNNLASMGIYIFTWDILKKYLINDHYHPYSEHDFGRNILPEMLADQEQVFTYTYNSYWKDVGTVHELWRSNMDLLGGSPTFKITDHDWRIYTAHNSMHPYYYYQHSNITNSLVSKNCEIHGSVENSVVSGSVYIGKGAKITNSVIMPNSVIGKGVKINRAIIGTGTKIQHGVKIGMNTGTEYFTDKEICQNGISLVAPQSSLHGNISFCEGSHIDVNKVTEAVIPNHIQMTPQTQYAAKQF